MCLDFGVWFVVCVVLLFIVLLVVVVEVLVKDILLFFDCVWIVDGDVVYVGWVVLVYEGKVVVVGLVVMINVFVDVQCIILFGIMLMFGLIDLYLYLFLYLYNEMLWNDQVFIELQDYCMFEVVVYVKVMLLVGFIVLCDFGIEGVGFVDVLIKCVIDNGLIFGLWMFVVICVIVVIVSYGFGLCGFCFDFDLLQGVQLVIGVDVVVVVVCEQVVWGVDWIKFYVDYCVGDYGEMMFMLLLVEIWVIVDVVYQIGCFVVVYVVSEVGVCNVVEVGVDIIEYGYGISEVIFCLMKQKGIVYEFMFIVVEVIFEYFQYYVLGKLEFIFVMKEVEYVFCIVLKVGLIIGNGSDVGVFVYGENWCELVLMVVDGMILVQVLYVVIDVVVCVLCEQDYFGCIVLGQFVDLVVFVGDFSCDIQVLCYLVFVMKSGIVYCFFDIVFVFLIML